MNKIAYNANDGGFGLSREAIMWLGRHGIYNKYPDIDDLDNLPRHEPLLIQCIEELGDDANRNYANLAIAEIASDTYYIVERDGWETIITPKDMIKIESITHHAENKNN